MASYTLRRTNPALWREVRSKVSASDLVALVERLLTEWLRKGENQ